MKKLREMDVGQTAIYGMANLRPDDTGLPMVIWVSEKGGAKHGPRIKVSKKMGDKIDPGNTLTVTVPEAKQIGGTLPPKVFQQVKAFIILNGAVILQYWEQKISTKEMLDALKKVKE